MRQGKWWENESKKRKKWRRINYRRYRGIEEKESNH